MKLLDNGDHFVYELGATVLTVSRLLVDAAFTLELVSPEITPEWQVSIRIGGRFRCTDAGGVDSEFDPEGDREGLGRVLGLWGARVSGIRIEKSASLVVRFADERALTVPPDPKFEAWTLNDHEGLLVVGGPGDRVSVFRPVDNDQPRALRRYRVETR
jgi:hypothetical protein